MKGELGGISAGPVSIKKRKKQTFTFWQVGPGAAGQVSNETSV